MEIYIIRDAEYTFVDTNVTFESATWTNNIPLGDEIVFSLTDDSTVVRGYVKEKSQQGNTVTLKLYGYIREFGDLFSTDNTPASVNAVVSYGNDSTYFDVTLTGYNYTEGDTLAFGTAPRTGHNVEIYTFSNHDVNDFERTSHKVVYGSSYAPEGTEFYFDRNLLTKGTIKLAQPAVSANYVWVIKNGKLLSPNIDYVLNGSKDTIQLSKKPRSIGSLG